jgi:protein ImuA
MLDIAASPSPGDGRRALAALRARVGALERNLPALAGAVGPDGGAGPSVSLGAAAIDAALPWGGLPLAGVHEVGGGDAAALGFAAALLVKFAAAQPDKPILWCQRGHDLYGPGLAGFGLDPARLILLHGRDDADMLWAMEEGLRDPGLAAVLGRVARIPPVAARRLQLAAEHGGTAGLLLRMNAPQAPAAAALTRWRVDPAPSARPAHGPGPGMARWQVGLQRCRVGARHAVAGGFAQPRSWLVEWCDETGDLSVVAELRDRSAFGPQGPAEPPLEATGTG